MDPNLGITGDIASSSIVINKVEVTPVVSVGVPKESAAEKSAATSVEDKEAPPAESISATAQLSTTASESQQLVDTKLSGQQKPVVSPPTAGATEEEKKLFRAQRFGIVTSAKEIAQMSTGKTSAAPESDNAIIEKMKKRAEKFGIISPILAAKEAEKAKEDEANAIPIIPFIVSHPFYRRGKKRNDESDSVSHSPPHRL